MPKSEKRQCPLCGKTNGVPSRLLGKKIRCVGCKEVFTAIEEELEELDEVEIVEDKPRRRSRRGDDDDDRPRRSKMKKKKRRESSSSGRSEVGPVREMIFGGIALVLGLATAIGTIVNGVPRGGGAFGTGQIIGMIFGFILLIGGIITLLKAWMR